MLFVRFWIELSNNPLPPLQHCYSDGGKNKRCKQRAKFFLRFHHRNRIVERERNNKKRKKKLFFHFVSPFNSPYTADSNVGYRWWTVLYVTKNEKSLKIFDLICSKLDLSCLFDGDLKQKKIDEWEREREREREKMKFKCNLNPILNRFFLFLNKIRFR